MFWMFYLDALLDDPEDFATDKFLVCEIGGGRDHIFHFNFVLFLKTMLFVSSMFIDIMNYSHL